MSFRSLLLIPFLALTACPDEEVPGSGATPAPDLALESGAYELHVLGVESAACDIDAHALVGRSLTGTLEGRGKDVHFFVEGVDLSGTMSGGWLELSGGQGGDKGEPEPVPVDTFDTGGVVVLDEDEDVAAEKCAADVDGDDPDEVVDYPDEGEDARPDEREASRVNVTLEASILDTRLAEGSLGVEVEGCAAHWEVAMVWVGGDEPVSAVTLEAEPGEGGGEVGFESEGCGEDEDCG